MTLPSSVTETPETDSDRVSEERLRGAARDLLGALQKYGFPVSDAATRQLMDGGSLEAQAVHVAAKGLATALRTTPSLPPRSGGVVVKGLEWESRVAWRWTAASLVGNYEVDADSATPGEEFIWSLDREYGGYASTVPAAKAAAQADYEARIRSTLADPIPEAPADEEVEGDERGWLVELKPSVSRQPMWFHLDDEWTTDSAKALRFARKADAEAFIAHSGWTEAFASEHMWGSPASSAADKEGVRDEDEMYEIGKRDGYEDAVQDIDLMTGGDGEYRVVLGGGDEDRHCPDPAAMKARIAERFDALRSRPETDKPGVREAALEEAAKVAASFGDPVCNPFTFTRHAHAQEVATAIRALSASPAREEQAVDVEADRRERASKVKPDKHGHRTRFSDSSYFDEVCIMCGATDGFGDKRLDQPCPKPLPTTGGATK